MKSRVAIALRLLAGASYTDIVDKHGVSIATVGCRLSTVDCRGRGRDAINASDNVGPFCFPGGEEECCKRAAEFKV